MLITFVASVISKGGASGVQLLSVVSPKGVSIESLNLVGGKAYKTSYAIVAELVRQGIRPDGDDLFFVTFRRVTKNLKFQNVVKIERGYKLTNHVFLSVKGFGKMKGSIYILARQVDAVINGYDSLLYVARRVYLHTPISEREGFSYTIPYPMSKGEAGEISNYLSNYGVEAEIVDSVGGGAVAVSEPVVSEPVVSEPEPEEKEEATPVAPPPTNYFYVSDDTRQLVSGVCRNLVGFGGSEKAVNLLFTGDSGNGKTALAGEIAKRLGFEFEYVNCALLVEPEDIAVRREVRNGSTVVDKKRFFNLVEAGHCVVVLDEINRVPPNVHGPIFALLDWRREETFLGEKLVVGDNVIFIATANIGEQFTGTFLSDAALMNRFETVVNIGVPPVNEEEKIVVAMGIDPAVAISIVSAMNHIRIVVPDVAVSVRTTKTVASLVKGGLPLRDAIQAAIINRLPADERKTIVDCVNAKLGARKAPTSTKKFLI